MKFGHIGESQQIKILAYCDASYCTVEDRTRSVAGKMIFLTDEEEISRRIAVEERKLLVAQRKLESIRLLDELLERVKVIFHVFRSVLQKGCVIV